MRNLRSERKTIGCSEQYQCQHLGREVTKASLKRVGRDSDIGHGPIVRPTPVYGLTFGERCAKGQQDGIGFRRPLTLKNDPGALPDPLR